MDRSDSPASADTGEATGRDVLWADGIWNEYLTARHSMGPEDLFISKNQQLKDGFIGAYSGSVMEGVLNGDNQPVAAILRRDPALVLRPQRERINGASCQVIDATTKEGRYTIWFDTDHGYNIARAEVQKRGDDEIMGRRLSTPMRADAPQIAKALGRLTEFTFRVDNVRFEKIGVVWVPMEADFSGTRKFEHGRSDASLTHHKRTKVELQPDWSSLGAFLRNYPDGTRVRYLEDMPESSAGISWIWKGGKVVPQIPEGVIENIDRTIPQLATVHDSVSPDKAIPTSAPGLIAARGELTGNATRLNGPLVSMVIAAVAAVVCAILWLRSRTKQPAQRQSSPDRPHGT